MTPEEKLIRMRENCDKILLALLGETASKAWWSSRNLAFDMHTPDQQWGIDATQVYKYLLNQVGR